MCEKMKVASEFYFALVLDRAFMVSLVEVFVTVHYIDQTIGR